MDDLVLAFSKTLCRFTLANAANLPSDTDAFVLLGKADLAIGHHVVPAENVTALRNWLNKVLPLDPTMDDLRKYAVDPMKPMRGEVVTVADFNGLEYVGEPQVLLDHVDGFEFLNSRQQDGSITAKMMSFRPSATVLLAHTDSRGVITTQVAPVLALRPYADSRAVPQAPFTVSAA